MLTNVITKTGSYKKYQPTKDEIVDLFKDCLKYSFIKPFELEELLQINLKKWNMMSYYSEIIKSLGMEE